MAVSPTTRTVQEVRDYVVRQFGDESGVQVNDTDIIRWVNNGCYDIVSKSHTLKKTVTTDVVAAQAEYSIPADVLRIEWINFNDVPVEHKTYGAVREQNLNQLPFQVNGAQPMFWYDWADKIVFYPTPTAALVNGITIFYSASPPSVTELSDVLPIPDLMFNRLLEYVLAHMHELDEEWSAAAAKDGQFRAGMDLIAEEERNQGMGFYPTITIRDEDL